MLLCSKLFKEECYVNNQNKKTLKIHHSKNTKDYLTTFLQQGTQKNTALFKFLDEPQLAALPATSKKLKSSIASYNETRFYHQIVQFVKQANDDFPGGKSLKEALEHHNQNFPFSLNLKELISLIEQPLLLYLESVNSNILKDNFQDPAELLLKPITLQNYFSKNVQDQLNIIQKNINEKLYYWSYDHTRVSLLLAHGGDFNYKKGMFTVLQQAVVEDRALAVKRMILAGADVNYASYCHVGNGYQSHAGIKSLLMIASELGHEATVKTLLEFKADVNKSYPPHEEIIQGLTFLSYSHETALHYAARRGHKEVAEILINAGADLNLADDDGNTPLLMALAEDHSPILDLICDKYLPLIEINHANDEGNTALMIAAGRAIEEDDVKKLIAAGSDIFLKNKKVETAHDLAMEALEKDLDEYAGYTDGGRLSEPMSSSIVDMLEKAEWRKKSNSAGNRKVGSSPS